MLTSNEVLIINIFRSRHKLCKENVMANVWLTKKIRMRAAEKNSRLHHLSHIYLTYYSVFIVGLNIFQNNQGNNYTNYSEIMLLLSVVVLCASIFVYGLDFSGRAREFRDCLTSAPMRQI